MSKLAEFKALEAKLAEQLRQLDAMKNDGALEREIEFETKLKALMNEYGVSLKEIVAVLNPQSGPSVELRSPVQRRQRQTKVYKHPETGEIVETKGGNHRVLKMWKTEHGAQVVEGWRQ